MFDISTRVSAVVTEIPFTTIFSNVSMLFKDFWMFFLTLHDHCVLFLICFAVFYICLPKLQWIGGLESDGFISSTWKF